MQTKAPSCTEKGEERRDCETCDGYETRAIAANGHTNKDAVVENKVDETCTKDGSYDSVIYCAVCNGEVSRETKVLPKLGHDRSTEWTVDVKPTCTEKGSKSHHCSRCSDRADVTEIAATGHTWGVWSQTKAPSCTEKGEERRDCKACDGYETRTIAANGHIESGFVIDVAATIYSEGSQHTYCTVCNSYIQTDVVIPRIVSDGLAYGVNSDGTTCTITGVGTCTDTQISIPDTIDGYKVTAIGENAFANCSSVTDIVLSKNIITIGRRAFYSCTNLTEIRIPSSVETFGEQIFYKATALKTVYCDSSFIGSVLTITRIERVVFGCKEIRRDMCPLTIKHIELTNNVTNINVFAFSGCTELISITVDEKNTIPQGIA